MNTPLWLFVVAQVFLVVLAYWVGVFRGREDGYLRGKKDMLNYISDRPKPRSHWDEMKENPRLRVHKPRRAKPTPKG